MRFHIIEGDIIFFHKMDTITLLKQFILYTLNSPKIKDELSMLVFH